MQILVIRECEDMVLLEGEGTILLERSKEPETDDSTNNDTFSSGL